MASESKKVDKKAGKPASPEEILAHFQQLRQEQRNVAQKLSEIELDLNEHKMVIETLKHVNEDRKCFRLVGGILTERKVKDVLPQLVTHKEKLEEVIKRMNETLVKKGQEIFEYKEKHNIKIRDGPDIRAPEKDKEEENTASGPQNVLVS